MDSSIVSVIAILVAGVLFRWGQQWLNHALSSAIHLFLIQKFSIKSVNGAKSLPSARYKFPNGQGSEMKFFGQDILAQKWRAEYGSIYRIWAGTVSEVVLTRADQVQQVYKDSNMHCKGENMDSGWLLGQLLGNCLGLINQQDWTRVHGLFAKHFDRSASLAQLPFIDEKVSEHLDRLEKTNETGAGKYSFRASEDFKFLAFKLIAEVLYGPLPETLAQDLMEIVPQHEKLWLEGIKGGISRFTLSQILPNETNRLLRKFQQKWKKFNNEACDNARRCCPDAPIVQLFDSWQRNEMTQAELLHTMHEILFANLDVTVASFSWNPLFLATNPEVQAELRRELSAAISAGSGLQQYIARNDTLLMACILESARLKPLAAFTLAQSAPTEREIDGYIIPAGTNFLVDTQSINMTDPFWGKDASSYNPKRFLAHSPTTLRYRYWRFGFGPRQCLGKYVGDIMLKVLVARMLERYQFELRPTDIEAWKREPEVWMRMSMDNVIYTKI